MVIKWLLLSGFSFQTTAFAFKIKPFGNIKIAKKIANIGLIMHYF